MYPTMPVPSGRVFDELDLRLVRELARIEFITWREQPFVLKSGIKSHVYVRGRDDLTRNPDALWLFGRKIASFVSRLGDSDQRIPAFVGLPAAGTALAAAAALADSQLHILSPAAAFFIMREKNKGHGAEKDRHWIVGHPDPAAYRLFAIDNTATDGKTKEEAAEKFLEDGYDAFDLDYIIGVDRQQGAVINLKNKRFTHIHAVYHLLDLTYALGTLGVWPGRVTAQVAEEIRQHQLYTA